MDAQIHAPGDPCRMAANDMIKTHSAPRGAPVAAMLALVMFTLLWPPPLAGAQELPSTIFSAGGPALIFTSDAWSLILPLGATRSLQKTGVFIAGSDIFTFSAPRIQVRWHCKRRGSRGGTHPGAWGSRSVVGGAWLGGQPFAWRHVRCLKLCCKAVLTMRRWCPWQLVLPLHTWCLLIEE